MKNPKTHKLDKNVIMDKLRSEGVLIKIINSLPVHWKLLFMSKLISDQKARPVYAAHGAGNVSS